MIYEVTVTNYLNDSIKMTLTNPSESGFNIYNITGLGPGRGIINTTEMVTSDGALYNSARLPPRNIMMYIRFMFKDSIEDSRQLSYKYFPIKKPVTLYIRTDNRYLKIVGYVESNEPVIFEKREYTQISLLCPNPYFTSADVDGKKLISFYYIDPLFEFPFSNESLTTPLLEFGEIISEFQKNIYYNGEADTGILMSVYINGYVSGKIYLNKTSTGELLTIDISKIETIIGSPLRFRDEIFISTVKGNKYIRFLRDGVYTNILNSLDKNSKWFELSRGDNIIAYDADYGVENLRFTVEYELLFEGI